MDELPPGYLERLFEIESSGNRYRTKGLYRGLGQFSRELERKYGITDWTDPRQQAAAVGQEVAEHRPALTRVLGRDPTLGELYLSHQQGLTGARALLGNPDRPAWQVIRPYYPDWLAKQKGFASGDDMARAVIKGNIPTNNALSSVDPDKITARDYARLWISKFEGTDQPVPLPRPRPPSAPRGSLDQPQSDLADSGVPPGPSNLLGPPQPSLADGDGAFPAPLSQMQMAPQPLSASWAPPTSAPIPPALRPLDPFFLPPGLNAGGSQAWPPIGAGDRSGTLDVYNRVVPPLPWLPSGPFGGALSAGRPQSPMALQQVSAPTPPIEDLLLDGTRELLPASFRPWLYRDSTSASPVDGVAPCLLSSPTGPFGGGPMPDGPFAPPPFSGALAAGRPQTQVIPQRVSAPTPSMEDLIPEALKPLVPHLFPHGFNPDWTPASPPASAGVNDGGAVAFPSQAQATPRQTSAPDPAAIDLLPPELRILVPLFFPQGFGNG
jgi:hypothetical protein